MLGGRYFIIFWSDKLQSRMVNFSLFIYYNGLKTSALVTKCIYGVLVAEM
jgi:hypothetical protein